MLFEDDVRFSQMVNKWKINHIITHNKKRADMGYFRQPSVSSYFYWIVERADWIVRELDASAKQETWQGWGWALRKIIHSAPSHPSPLACFALALLAFSFACVEKQGNSEQSRVISLQKIDWNAIIALSISVQFFYFMTHGGQPQTRLLGLFTFFYFFTFLLFF